MLFIFMKWWKIYEIGLSWIARESVIKTECLIPCLMNDPCTLPSLQLSVLTNQGHQSAVPTFLQRPLFSNLDRELFKFCRVSSPRNSSNWLWYEHTAHTLHPLWRGRGRHSHHCDALLLYFTPSFSAAGSSSWHSISGVGGLRCVGATVLASCHTEPWGCQHHPWFLLFSET